MNGAVASAAMPSGTRPPCRAIAGSSAPTTALVIPMPTAPTRSSDRFRRTAAGPVGRRPFTLDSTGPDTTYLAPFARPAR